MTMKWKSKHVNASIKKDCPKVVDTVEIEDLGDKTAFCRCWKSKKFPLCDGSHAQHNKDTGDNLGPLCIKRRGAE
jgi:CDGSH-type Zn-finger protein